VAGDRVKVPPELFAHREWLGQIGQVGLVVSPTVLVEHGVFINRQRAVEAQAKLRELIPEDDEQARVFGAERIFRELLGWPAELLAGGAGGPELPDSLTVALPTYEDYLKPNYAVPAPHGRDWLLLVQIVKPGVDLDQAAPQDAEGWRASPQARFERLLRETGVGIGILINGVSLRLVYAPKGESSGHLTFTFRYLLETQGRPMAGALCALLDPERVSDVGIESQRLPALLRESRKSQNDVSTDLADQVLEALWKLVQGFQQANESTKGRLLGEALREDSREVYGGLLTTLMRLVFILYAEDRSLMPEGEVYQRHYAVTGLFERLREDEARHPDTMDGRYGAWAQLLALFRLIHDGGSHGSLYFTARHGRLFDPDAYPFLEGRPHRTTRSKGERVAPPKVSDCVVYRVLHNLLILKGERLSYRTLDVEQIGSVYEAMMGFALEQATGPSIAVLPKHVVINLQDVLTQKPSDRAKWLADEAELKVKPETLAKATTTDEVVAALGKKVSPHTKQTLLVNALYLQPTEERRRSGSHYTPRSLTQPIVFTTCRPIFERLGDAATPEQILELKVCDPAMGSGAFLVEACRLLADRLVRAWEVHRQTPKVPDDEDVVTYARRLVAERCLYGVDKNVFAVDLAKLSLWLATLAREHPFTFLDHALRHGDSLVGLSREQIACFNWEVEAQLPLLRSLIDARVAEAQGLREQIQGLASSDDVPRKAHLLRDAEDALADVRLIGDLVIASFFERDKPKERKALRAVYAGKVDAWLASPSSSPSSYSSPTSFSPTARGADRTWVGHLDPRPSLAAIAAALREGGHPIPPFHWEIEFPEVFTRTNGGFDVFVGNPPFAGKNTMAAANRAQYPVWLQALHEESHGNADLVAHFYRRAFDLLRQRGAFGLIATNTISQGDTRSTGLRWIRHHHGTMFAARKRVKWPGQAAVVVSVVHVHKGELAGPFELDGRQVDRITAFLFHTGGDDDPARLAENANRSFQGSIVLGMGFTFDDTDKKGIASPISLMNALIKRDPRNGDRIFPYIGGEEVNDSPTHSHDRYVINFEQMSEGEARRWPELMAIVEARVRPERLAQNDRGARDLWWQFIRPRPELHAAIRGLGRVLACTLHQEHWALAFLPSTVVFSHGLGVIATESLSQFCILQCRVHEVWARFFGSSLEERFRYTPSDCFESFPFPLGSESSERLRGVGNDYYAFRAISMIQHGEGLTNTYGRFHDRDERDADIVKLRDLHAAMDRAVLDAYGWTDIQPHCEFILDYEDEEDDNPAKPSKKRKPFRYRWPDDIRDEVLGRLLELNAERARAEASTNQRGGKTKRNERTADTPLLD
jgi:hypothetical protein